MGYDGEISSSSSARSTQSQTHETDDMSEMLVFSLVLLTYSIATVVAERHQQNVPAGFKLTEEQPNQQEVTQYLMWSWTSLGADGRDPFETREQGGAEE